MQSNKQTLLTEVILQSKIKWKITIQAPVKNDTFITTLQTVKIWVEDSAFSFLAT